MKVLVLVAHTRRRSLCEALGRAYAEGARGAGATVRECHLADLRFDPDVHGRSPNEQPLEPDLQRVWDDLLWADHLVVVFPAWWGVGPARLKGLLDRLLRPGSAFEETADGRYHGLLGGRTAHLLTTLDMPPWVYRWIYRAPGLAALRRSTLGLCGVRTTPAAATLLLLAAFAVGYTAPPLRLSWRGWGEVDVALTHSIGAMAWGAAALGGDPLDPALWALSLPLALAILPSIVLSGLPDRSADAAAGKRTLAVRCGARGAVRIAAAAVVAANGALWSVQGHPASLGALAGLWPLVGAHSSLLLGLLRRHDPLPGGRIDGLMVASLTLILWLVGAPLLRLG